jgi:hypothetical protein
MSISRRVIIFGGLAAVLAVGAVGFVVVQVGNDFHCSGTERGAMSEFPHFGGAEADWESNFKITGGCTTSYTAEAELPEVLSYYQEHLGARGWAVSEPLANSFPSSFHAERGELRFSLQFEGSQVAQLEGWPPAEASARAEQIRREEANADFLGVKEGYTRVSISGGHRN